MAARFTLYSLLVAAFLVAIFDVKGTSARKEGKTSDEEQGQAPKKPYCEKTEDCEFLLTKGDENRAGEGVFAKCSEVMVDGATKKVCVLAFATDSELEYSQTAKDPIACNCVPRDNDNPPKAKMACEKALTNHNGIFSIMMFGIERNYKLSSPKPGTTDISYVCTNVETGKKYVTCPLNAVYKK